MPNKPKETIHVVEDDPAVARLMAQALEKFGFEAQFFATGADFLRRLDSDPPRLCVLDLGLPDMDGLDILRQIRARHGFGLLIVTGRGDTHDRVTGLELGADDYMVKPFEPREFIARVRSILRRYREPPPAAAATANSVRVAEFAGWRFEPGNNALTSPGGETETLSMAEARLLGALLQRPNQILTREQLLGGRDVAALDRSIDLRISRLRKRLEENPLHPKLIKTVYGAGYLFSSHVDWL